MKERILNLINTPRKRNGIRKTEMKKKNNFLEVKKENKRKYNGKNEDGK